MVVPNIDDKKESSNHKAMNRPEQLAMEHTKRNQILEKLRQEFNWLAKEATQSIKKKPQEQKRQKKKKRTREERNYDSLEKENKILNKENHTLKYFFL